MLLQTLLQKRSNGIFYIRWVVPLKQRPFFKKTELVKSIGTRNLLKASAIALRFEQEIAGVKGLISRMSDFSEEEYSLLCQQAWENMQSVITSHRGLIDDRLVEEHEAAKLYLDTLRDNFNAYENSFDLTFKACKVEMAMAGIDEENIPPSQQERFAQDLLKISAEVIRKKLEDIEFGLKRQLVPPRVAMNLDEQRQGMTYKELYALFKRNKCAEGLKPKVMEANDRLSSLFDYVFGDRVIAEINKKEVTEFFYLCLCLPVRNKNPYRTMSLAELFRAAKELAIPEVDRVQGKSILEVKKLLQGVFKVAVDEGVIPVSPINGIMIDEFYTKEKRGKFSNVSLLKFYRALELLNENELARHRAWVILIAIYSGARLGEIWGLRGCDLLIDEDTKIAYFNHNKKSGATKNDNAMRRTPVHSKLVELGLLSLFDASSEERVFWAVKSSQSITKWFPTFRDKCGVAELDPQGKSQTFHSFRHTFINNVRNTGISDYLLQQVVGHQVISAGLTDNYSKDGAEISMLLEVVERFDFPLS